MFSPSDKDYLESIAHMSAGKICARLMGKIGSAKQYGRQSPESWWQMLEAHCERKRFKRFCRNMEKIKQSPNLTKVRITKTVRYRYDEGDNVRLSAFYKSQEWALARYETLRGTARAVNVAEHRLQTGIRF